LKETKYFENVGVDGVSLKGDFKKQDVRAMD
jgi:hypothetical protein